MLVSLREFCGKVVRRWYALAVGVIGGTLGLASALYAEAKPKATPLVPLRVWLALLVGGYEMEDMAAVTEGRSVEDATFFNRGVIIRRTVLTYSGTPSSEACLRTGRRGRSSSRSDMAIPPHHCGSGNLKN